MKTRSLSSFPSQLVRRIHRKNFSQHCPVFFSNAHLSAHYFNAGLELQQVRSTPPHQTAPAFIQVINTVHHKTRTNTRDYLFLRAPESAPRLHPVPQRTAASMTARPCPVERLRESTAGRFQTPAPQYRHSGKSSKIRADGKMNKHRFRRGLPFRKKSK